MIILKDLQIKKMTKSAKGNCEEPGKMVKQKSGLNRVILEQGWGNVQNFFGIQTTLVGRSGIVC